MSLSFFLLSFTKTFVQFKASFLLKVNFETISLKKSHGTLAVDDIVFLKGGCPSAGEYNIFLIDVTLKWILNMFWF